MSNNIIGQTALKCAWPYKYRNKLSVYSYANGKPYGEFKKAINATFPHRSGWSRRTRLGCSCDVFVGVVVRYSQADKKFPRGLREVHKYVRTKSFKNKFYRVGRNVPVSKLQGGDIQIVLGHIQIVVEVGKKKYIANAHHEGHGGTYGVLDKRASSGGGYRTYRLRGKINRKYDDQSKITKNDKDSKTNFEYYVTKPSNFSNVQDKITHSENVVLEQSIALKTTLQDWQKIKKYYSTTEDSKISKKYNLSIEQLINNYSKMVQLLTSSLQKINNFNKNKKYIYFYNNKNGYPMILSYTSSDDINKDYTYYVLSKSISIENWVELYKDIYLKYMALQGYQEAKNNFTSIFSTSIIKNEFLKEIKFDFDNNLSLLYQKMQDYVKENTQKFEDNDDLNQINQQITLLELDKNNINQILYTSFKDQMNLSDEIAKYEKILQNILQMKETFKEKNFSDDYTYWNKAIIQEPNKLNFWLEFSNSNEMENYSVNLVGRKGYGETNDKVTSVYYREVPQVIFYSNKDMKKTKTGYVYLYINNMDTVFKNSSQGLSAKNIIDDLLYNHTYCTQDLTLSIVPIHYLEPNTRILIYNEKTKVNNEYIIHKISNPINYNGTMTINATQVVERLY